MKNSLGELIDDLLPQHIRMTIADKANDTFLRFLQLRPIHVVALNTILIHGSFSPFTVILYPFSSASLLLIQNDPYFHRTSEECRNVIVQLKKFAKCSTVTFEKNVFTWNRLEFICRSAVQRSLHRCVDVHLWAETSSLATNKANEQKWCYI